MSTSKIFKEIENMEYLMKIVPRKNKICDSLNYYFVHTA